ncbi:MAG TPA: PEP-CTERM sorting domain-containing protein [Thiobacillus sp.]
MKSTHSFLPRLRHSLFFAATLTVVGVPVAQATSITCGDLTLGLRTTTVDPALGCLYAGLGPNPGDPQLVALVDSLIAPSTSTLLERDATDSNGGVLNITGVGGSSGTWAFDPSVWNNDRVFLYFHFGDAQDNPGPTSTTDPDIFIVELKSPDTSGTWSFGGGRLTGLSNVGLLGSGSDGGGGGGGSIPEPGSLLLMGAGLMGFSWVRRRKLS